MFAFTYSYIMIQLALIPIIYHPQAAAIDLISKIFFILMILSIIFFIVVITYITPAATLIYLKTNRFLSFYMFEEIFALIKKCTKKYLLNSTIILILSIIIDLFYKLNEQILKFNNPILWLLLIPSIIVVIFFHFNNIYHLAKIKDDALVEFE